METGSLFEVTATQVKHKMETQSGLSRRFASVIALLILAGCLPRSKSIESIYSGFSVSHLNDSGKTPNVIRIDLSSTADIDYVVIFPDGAELELRNLTRKSLEEWAKERSKQLDYSDSIALAKLTDYGDGNYFYFTGNGNLKECALHDGVAQVKIAKGGKSVAWPCSKEEVVAAFGSPNSTKEHDRSVPFGVR